MTVGSDRHGRLYEVSQARGSTPADVADALREYLRDKPAGEPVGAGAFSLIRTD